MKISATQTGFALYKEADIIGQCNVTPTPKGADITALSVLPQWVSPPLPQVRRL